MASNLVYQEVIRAIDLELGTALEKAFASAKRILIPKIRQIIEDSIKNHPIYHRFVAGDEVYHQFGIPGIQGRMDKIIKLIVQDIKFDYVLPTNLSTGNVQFLVTVLDLDFEKILNSEEAQFHTSNGYTLPWLDWLLLSSNSPVVFGFHYFPFTGKKQSRTGTGLMIPNGNWAVPSSINTNPNNNWLTQSLDRVNDEISIFVEDTIANSFF